MMKKFDYYFDYSKEALDYILASKILRNRDKCILKDLVDGKKVKELASIYNCSERSICTRRKEIFERTQHLM
jgi:Mor family transcriptional regulator